MYIHKVIAIIMIVYWPYVNAEKPVSKNHTHAIGVHGMALLVDEENFYASHMPLANSMHSHQVVFTFNVENKHSKKIIELSKSNKLLSIMPEKFDLIDLMDGSLTSFKAEIFAGHFERGGKVALSNIVISVEKILLSQPLSNVKNGSFYILPTTSDKGLLIHKIGKLPSFDQVLSIRFKQENMGLSLSENISLIDLTNNIPFNSKDKQKVTHSKFSISRQLYLELQDFR
ncbi:hypothetical protein [Agarilytica rhodophyticola]|uniref:hypothetical protein n=1 Tax=Agarilytica rhodophyticola TaxID=1737490 RepID=UPI000B3411EB|nr:hypothetical protein [Agarilytica rhodophyticola]